MISIFCKKFYVWLPGPRPRPDLPLPDTIVPPTPLETSSYLCRHKDLGILLRGNLQENEEESY